MTEEGGGASRTTDPAAGTSSATDVSLREYVMAAIGALERKFDLMAAEREKQVALSLTATQRATEKAEAEALRAREAQNEWRATTTDLIGRFATNETVESMKDRLNLIERMQARIAGGLVVVAIAAPIASHFIK